MGPPGSGKSTIGNRLNARGIASYVELEPIIVKKFGEGEEFIPKRPEAHRWIRDFYREQITTSEKPVVYETTGISDRDFHQELSTNYKLFYVGVVTCRSLCLERVKTRPRGHNVNASSVSTGEFYDYWYSEIEPTYKFDLLVDGTDVDGAVGKIAKELDGRT